MSKHRGFASAALGLVVGLGIALRFLVWAVPGFRYPANTETGKQHSANAQGGDDDPVKATGFWEIYTTPRDTYAQWIASISGALGLGVSIAAVFLVWRTLELNWAATNAAIAASNAAIEANKILKFGRRKVRDGWGIEDDVLVLGMVGQFKSQKAYTRAVRVLARVLAFIPAKLMIVGGWDHAYGDGRVAFEAAMRLAVDLGVSADMILIGQTADPVPYFAAFDVFLNTSIFEGLSVSLMEAMACGCPLVLSAVGGTAEIAPPEAVLVEDPADVDAYVAGILQVASRDVRALPPPRNDPDLVPQCWLGLAKVASALARPRYPAANGTLFVTDGLHLSGPAVSLARTLAARKRRSRGAVAVLHGVSATALAEDLRGAGIALFQLDTSASLSRTVNRLLDCLISGNYASICFWNAQPEVKLLLAKLLQHNGELRDRLRAPFRQPQPNVPSMFKPKPPLLRAA